jgi:hypothetical protein
MLGGNFQRAKDGPGGLMEPLESITTFVGIGTVGIMVILWEVRGWLKEIAKHLKRVDDCSLDIYKALHEEAGLVDSFGHNHLARIQNELETIRENTMDLRKY